eukprot:jgi/Bigna1/87636/estExt_fgenesh1_pg.C_220151
MYIVHVGTMFHTHKLLGDGQGGGDKSVKEAGRSTTTRTRGVLLPHQWKGENVTGWWMSEKLDGIRAYWDGLQLLSRNGAKLSAPTWFTEGLPTDLHLDGELIGDHNEYQATSKIVQSFAGGDEQWQKLTYEVFDAPSLDIPFEKRLERVRGQAEKKQNAYLRVVQHTRCKGQEHLEAELERMSKDGAKGLMLRKPHSKYVRSRSKTLLKLPLGPPPILQHLILVQGKITFLKREGSIFTVKFSGKTKKGKPPFPPIFGVREGSMKTGCDMVRRLSQAFASSASFVALSTVAFSAPCALAYWLNEQEKMWYSNGRHFNSAGAGSALFFELLWFGSGFVLGIVGSLIVGSAWIFALGCLGTIPAACCVRNV